MTAILRRTLLLSLFPGLLLAGLLLAAAQAAVAQVQQIGQVETLRGEAQALIGENERALALGAPLHQGERVRCAEGGGLVILLLDGSRLTVGGGSEVRLDRYQVDSQGRREQGLFTLLRGVLRAVAEASPLQGPFDLQTRSAVASARSTDWILVEEAEKSAVFVVEGAVEVNAAGGGSLVLAAGLGVDIPHGEPLGTAKPWGQARVDQVLARTTLR